MPILESKNLWAIESILLLVILALLTACQSSAAASQAEMMYRGGPQRTGLYNTQAVDEFSGVKWKFETGDEVWSSPVVAEGVIYFGSDDDHLYALDAQTGEEKWRFKTGDDVRSSPAIADGIVYVVSYDGNLYAVNSQAGQLVWEFRVFKEDIAKLRPPYDDFLSSPLVAEGVVYVGAVDPHHCLYALDAQTGREKWSFGLTDTFETIHSSPTIAGDALYFGGDFNRLYALDINTGMLKWNFKTNGTVNYAPAVGEDGTVYFGSKDTYLYALNGQTGELKWKNKLAGSSWITSSPAIANGLVYANTSDGRSLFAVQVDTGEKKWSFPVGGYGWSSPSVAGDMVYVGGGGKVYALESQTGQEVWRFDTIKPIYSTPVIANGVVYVGSLDGNLYALN